MSPEARLRSAVSEPELLAAALRPDDTEEIETRVRDGAIETTIERSSTGGLRTTIDDYVVNLTVATELLDRLDRRAESDRSADADGTTPNDTP